MQCEALITAAAIAVSACGGSSKPAEGPAEQAGESADQTVKKASDKPGDLSNDTKEKSDELKKKANPDNGADEDTTD